MLADVGKSRRRTHDVVREMKNRTVCGIRDPGIFNRCRDERDVFPSVLGRARASEIDHLRTLFNSYDRASRSDRSLYRGKAEPGAAADIQNRIAAADTQQLDRARSHRLEQGQLEIIDPRSRAILKERASPI